MVRMHVIELRARGIEVGKHRQRHVVDPDVFPQHGAGSRCFDQQPALQVLDIVGDARRRHVEGFTPIKALEDVVAVGGAQLPADRPLSAVRVQVDGDRVIVRDSNTTWEPESGQTVLDFSVSELGRKVAPLARDSIREALRTAETPDQWFQAGLDSEQIGATSDAEAAYRKAIELDSRHVAALINLGRLRHVARALEEAEALYRRALACEADHPTARFNLGVVLEDRGATQEAIKEYCEAARLDPRVADVHYNLARLYQQSGDQQSALRHFSRFRALTRERND